MVKVSVNSPFVADTMVFPSGTFATVKVVETTPFTESAVAGVTVPALAVKVIFWLVVMVCIAEFCNVAVMRVVENAGMLPAEAVKNSRGLPGFVVREARKLPSTWVVSGNKLLISAVYFACSSALFVKIRVEQISTSLMTKFND